MHLQILLSSDPIIMLRADKQSSYLMHSDEFVGSTTFTYILSLLAKRILYHRNSSGDLHLSIRDTVMNETLQDDDEVKFPSGIEQTLPKS